MAIYIYSSQLIIIIFSKDLKKICIMNCLLLSLMLHLGTTVEVPSIDGGKSKIKIPAGTQHGKQFRLKGKGMPVLRRNMIW